MSQNQNRPKQYDAVLGNQAQAPVDGVVLGGLEGIKIRLITTDKKTQIAALCETLKYGEAGLDLVIQASKSTETQVQLAAERILIQQRNIPELKHKRHLCNAFVLAFKGAVGAKIWSRRPYI